MSESEMLIVAGWLRVEADERDSYVAGCADVVRAARAAPGCLDFAVAADVVDPARVTVYERWTDEESLLAFRGAGVPAEQEAQIVDAQVQRFTIADVGPP
ncbi:MAG TPA: antibiotic biosynthesis monooxygenase [Aldersonia sp.]